MIELQYLAAQRPLRTAVIPVASGSLPRAEGSLKLPVPEVHFPRVPQCPVPVGCQVQAHCHGTN